DQGGESGEADQHGAGQVGVESGAAQRLRLGRGRAGRGREAPTAAESPGPAQTWRPGAALLLRQSERVEPLQQLMAILLPHVAVLDGADMIHQPAAEARALLRSLERLGLALVPPEPVDQAFRALQQC